MFELRYRHSMCDPYHQCESNAALLMCYPVPSAALLYSKNLKKKSDGTLGDCGASAREGRP
eukprot:5276024-Karenia_brevis.AAC.1